MRVDRIAPLHRPRGFTVGQVLTGVGLALLLSSMLVRAIIAEGERQDQRAAERAARWDGAELVRICAGGEKLFQLGGRLVVTNRWTGEPERFAADVTPEAACAR